MSNTELLIRLNNVYGKFYNRRTGDKLYRTNFGYKYSRAAFRRANDAINYKSKVFLRYTNLSQAKKLYFTEIENNLAIKANLRVIENIMVVSLMPFVIALIVYLLMNRL